MVLGTLGPGLLTKSFLCVLRGRALAHVEKEGELTVLYLDFTKIQWWFLTTLRTDDISPFSAPCPLSLHRIQPLHRQLEELQD